MVFAGPSHATASRHRSRRTEHGTHVAASFGLGNLLRQPVARPRTVRSNRSLSVHRVQCHSQRQLLVPKPTQPVRSDRNGHAICHCAGASNRKSIVLARSCGSARRRGCYTRICALPCRDARVLRIGCHISRGVQPNPAVAGRFACRSRLRLCLGSTMAWRFVTTNSPTQLHVFWLFDA